MKSVLKKIKLAGLALTGALCLTACLNSDDESQQTLENKALGAFINASPNSPALRFYADGIYINTNPANYSQYFGYIPFEAGTRELIVRANNENLDTLMLNMEEHKRYSIFAVNHFENVELVAYPDDATMPPTGKALIRFIQLSPDAPGLRVSIEGEESLGVFNYKQSSGFMAVNETIHKDIYLIDETTQDTLVTKEIELTNGKIYSIFSKGFLNTETENQQLDVQIIPVFL
ncbi:MAG: DUF4397 domain-containing protein [Moheibacter sp.]